MERKMLCKIDFENRQELLPLSYKLKMLVRRAVETTLDYEQYENPIEVSVTFTDNEGIRELNRKFRNIDRPTDVLSFPLFDYTGESEEPPVDEFVGMLGDIVISLEQAKKQAEEFGHSFEREAAFQAYQNDDDVQQSIEDASIVELPRLESHLNILATISYIAPLLGLLGTVVGMADAFEAIQAKQGISLTLADLSGGIYQALATTTAGLIVAVISHIAYNYLVSRIQSFCVEMEKASSEILYFFKHHKASRHDEIRKQDENSNKA